MTLHDFSSSSSFPADLRRAGHGGQIEYTHRLRDAIGHGHTDRIAPLLPQAAKGALVHVADGTPKGQWLGWLAWAVWLESRSSTTLSYPEALRADAQGFPHRRPSRGVVEALLAAGVFDWDALTYFPDRRWANHAAFQAIEKAGLDRLARLPKDHKIYLHARSGGYSALSVYPRCDPQNNVSTREHDLASLDNDPSWLLIAVRANRADVVARWASHAPVMDRPNTYNSAWRLAWKQRLRHGAAGTLDTLDPNIPALIEKALIATSDTLFEKAHDLVRAEVFSLVGLLHHSRGNPRLHHAPTHAAMVQALERVVQQCPIDLTWSEDDQIRTLRSPFVQALLGDLERRVLRQGINGPTGMRGPVNGPVTQEATPRRRL